MGIGRSAILAKSFIGNVKRCSGCKHCICQNQDFAFEAWSTCIFNFDMEIFSFVVLSVCSYKGILGLKTGTTGAAGSCISACAERNGLQLIRVILGADNTNDRFSAASSLLDYGFSNWKTVTPELPPLPDLPVTHGMTEFVSLEAAEPKAILLPVSGQNTTEVLPELPDSLPAPVFAGQQVGRIRVVVNGETVEEIPVTAAQDAEAVTFSSAFRYLLDAFLCGVPQA